MGLSFLLVDIMKDSEGWGREQGREVYQRLIQFVEQHAGVVSFEVSMKGVKKIDISFSSETVVELAKRFRKIKCFHLVELNNQDIVENIDAAAKKKEQPILLWRGGNAQILGPEPSEGNREAFEFAMKHKHSRASEFASSKKIPIANASMKFKQLWEQGFLMRYENSAESGGVEYVYHRIG